MIPLEPGYLVSADPIVFFDVLGRPHILVLHAFGAPGNAFYQYTSTDGGLTFPGGSLLNATPRNDKEQVAVDRVAELAGRAARFGGRAELVHQGLYGRRQAL